MKTDTVELPKPDNGSIMVGREEVCLGHSDEAMREYAAQVAATENYGLLSLLFDIRKAAGDPTGKLMQGELVAHIAALRADAERYRWLKPHFRVMSPDMGGQHRYSPTGPVARMRGPTLDTAIDTERAAE